MSAATDRHLLDLLSRHWGYDAFLPNQAAAIDAVLRGRDALVILPTGGGKSMTYQLPALALGGLAVVISPLVSLMKDQVDALRENGVGAASLDSTLSAEERRDVVRGVRDGSVRLLYVAPERLATHEVTELLEEVRPTFFAVDEAHCVSHWGHEFRPEYRQLGSLRARFADVPILAATATATPLVRDDIVQALGLRDPARIVGDFDRPNLVYRARPRRDLVAQVEEVIGRHAGEAGIVYCIRRADVDELAKTLAARGHRVRPYHAGLDAAVRREHQQLFAEEKVDLVVATVAFGMGIDRSNVRFVVHAAMPKSLENYQQEAGRAGRDRLEAECVLLYEPQDAALWRRLQGAPQTEWDHLAQRRIDAMYAYCRALTCRHRTLVEHFGQTFDKASCDACDVCLGEHEPVPDSITLARKLLSGVARVNERFGVRYVAEVLKGSKNARILKLGHDALSTWGLLAEHALDDISDWLDQLVGLGHLAREPEYGALQLTASGRALMKGEGEVRLARPREVERRQKKKDTARSPEEDSLFEHLRDWRRDQATAREVPAFVVLGDATLHELSRLRPGDDASLRAVKGIGEAKAKTYGESLLREIRRWCEANGFAPGVVVRATTSRATKANPQKDEAIVAFRAGATVDEVASRTGRAASTIEGYLVEYVEQERIVEISNWVDEATYDRIIAAAAQAGSERLKPVFEALGGEVEYWRIRVALAVRANRSG